MNWGLFQPRASRSVVIRRAQAGLSSMAVRLSIADSSVRLRGSAVKG
jgi:hypothetical protein